MASPLPRETDDGARLMLAQMMLEDALALLDSLDLNAASLASCHISQALAIVGEAAPAPGRLRVYAAPRAHGPPRR